MNFNKEIEMSKCKEVISVWLDEATDEHVYGLINGDLNSNDVDGVWIVSRDKLTKEGKIKTTKTLSHFNDYENAVEFAKSKAHELELSVYETENTPFARNELIYGVYHAECETKNFASQTNTFFAESFSDAKDLVIEWAESGLWKDNDDDVYEDAYFNDGDDGIDVTVSLKGPDGKDSFVVTLEEEGA
jgi:hypothetical protein